jgi:hypothetical protein
VKWSDTTDISERFEHVASRALYIPIIGFGDCISSNPDTGAYIQAPLSHRPPVVDLWDHDPLAARDAGQRRHVRALLSDSGDEAQVGSPLRTAVPRRPNCTNSQSKSMSLDRELFHETFGKERGHEHPAHAGLYCPVQPQKCIPSRHSRAV